MLRDLPKAPGWQVTKPRWEPRWNLPGPSVAWCGRLLGVQSPDGGYCRCPRAWSGHCGCCWELGLDPVSTCARKARWHSASGRWPPGWLALANSLGILSGCRVGGSCFWGSKMAEARNSFGTALSVFIRSHMICNLNASGHLVLPLSATLCRHPSTRHCC